MKVCFKSFVAGSIVATIGVATVFAAGGIKSAVFNSNKVIVDGRELNLGAQQMMSVVLEGETYMSNYMPVRGVLTAMGYDVSWSGETNSVIVTSPKPAEPVAPVQPVVPEPADPEQSQAFTTVPTAAELDGNWVGSGGNDVGIQYTFCADGTIKLYAEAGGAFAHTEGTFVLNKNTVTATYAHMYAAGHYLCLPDEEPMVEVYQVGISADKNEISISETDEDTNEVYTMILKKADKPLALSGKSVPTVAQLKGTWSGEDTGVSAVFTFDGSKFTAEITDTDDETIEFIGTYKISDGKIHFEADKASANDESIDLGGKTIRVDYEVGISGTELVFADGTVTLELTKQ